MSYLYDIFLNFHNQYYDFIEWNNDDIFTHFKKIPVLKVSKKAITDILTYDIKDINNELISEVFSKKGIIKKDNYLILTDGKNSIGIEINNNKITNLSSMIIEEEEEANSLSKKLDTCFMEYAKGKKKKIILKTRLTLEKEKYIKNKLKNYYDNSKYDLIDYLYFECTGKDKKNKNINDFLDKDIDKLYNLLKSINV